MGNVFDVSLKILIQRRLWECEPHGQRCETSGTSGTGGTSVGLVGRVGRVRRVGQVGGVKM
ncbi:hypothetical protein [Capnocytophaga leadbetteri]|uniref:hypothetical protein n=1 Tax=Capnocytophaga leadbetteri TaxID=327575 RepID=UPI00288B0052|nr:hypothetical protein [Capnocytophaga leadbetteri]